MDASVRVNAPSLTRLNSRSTTQRGLNASLQSLQQVVGAAAIYNHLLSKHGGVGTRRRRTNGAAAVESGGKSTACGCGGAVGSCKARVAFGRQFCF